MSFYATSEKPCPVKTDLPSRNRVRNFSTASRFRTRQFPSQPLETTSETSVTLTITVSGLPFWPSRDPIDEGGGLNLYQFVGNNGVGYVDVLGRIPQLCFPLAGAASTKWDGKAYWWKFAYLANSKSLCVCEVRNARKYKWLHGCIFPCEEKWKSGFVERGKTKKKDTKGVALLSGSGGAYTLCKQYCINTGFAAAIGGATPTSPKKPLGE